MSLTLDRLVQTPSLGSATPSADGDRLLTRSQAWSLYLLHFLFTWNARTYEFAAIVFTAHVYPNTLTAASIRGIATTVASILFSSAIGRWIDYAPSRLRTLTSTISVHRLTILAAYLVWMLLTSLNANPSEQDVLEIPKAVHGNVRKFGFLKTSLFAIILALGVLERLSDIANGLTIDRDWLPVLVPSSAKLTLGDGAYDLTHLNAVMRRIDLICKLLTPFIISMFVSKTYHYLLGIIIFVLLNTVSWIIEIWCARWIYSTSAVLSIPKELSSSDALTTISKEERRSKKLARPWFIRMYIQSQAILSDQATALHQYLASSVWQPSIAWALLHLTVLAYSASLITYLLSIGLSLNLVTIARASGSIIEVSSTVLTPWIIHRLSQHTMSRPTKEIDTEASDFLLDESKSKPCDESVLKMVGLGGISWQFACLIPVVLSLFYLTTTTHPQPLLSTLLLFVPLSLSRLGYWTYDLTTQELTQTLVPASQRSSFAGTERSFQAFFQLCHWIATAIWGHPSMFPWLAVGSLGAVGAAGGLYSGWMWSQRGRGANETV